MRRVFILVWASNENQQYFFFDDVEIAQMTGAVVEGDTLLSVWAQHRWDKFQCIERV